MAPPIMTRFSDDTGARKTPRLSKDGGANALLSMLRGTVPIDAETTALALEIFQFFAAPSTSEELLMLTTLSKRWRSLIASDASLWQATLSSEPNAVDWAELQNLGITNKGTEGTCYKVRRLSTGEILAMKKAKNCARGEGVPYYFIRQLALLRMMQHPHIVPVKKITITRDELFMFYPFVGKTLDDLIFTTSGEEPTKNAERPLPEPIARRLLFQLLDAVAYCHRRGVVHRNLKPKHLLVQATNYETLDDAVLLVSDFAFTRQLTVETRTYTSEVVTVWYRPPELLMGEKAYTPAVDIWSIGCIFAAMIRGCSLFAGAGEIGVLFEIFSKFSTPTEDTWPSFTKTLNYSFEFPNWVKLNPFEELFPSLSQCGLDLMKQLLTYDPNKRISADEALWHPYFSSDLTSFRPTPLLNEVKSRETHFWKWVQEREESWRAPMFFSKSDCKLTSSHRLMLADWLIEVTDVFEMATRSAFLAVNYVDRFLDSSLVMKTHLQLLGAACLHVASKFEDQSYIGIDDLVMCANNVFTNKDALVMEEKVLTALQFDLAVPTAYDLVNVYEKLQIVSGEDKTWCLAYYLIEIALLEYAFAQYRPSVVATSALVLSVYTLEGANKIQGILAKTGSHHHEVQRCVAELHAAYAAFPTTECKIVMKRYNTHRRCCVAEISPPEELQLPWTKHDQAEDTNAC